ncbi:MAG: DUF4382 domain-containing protein [Acidobacteria bacterium]|nr:DUF4382 domain-containing protein [Acidobacteriota bacterium]
MRHAQRTLLVFAIAILTACGGSPSAPSSSPTLTVLLKDSPYSDAKALLVTFSDVSAHVSGSQVSGSGDWTTLPFTGGGAGRTCDLKKLTTAQDILGTGSLAAGHYTQIRLVVSSAALYFDNASSGAACAPAMSVPAGRSSTVTIPSGEVKLNREFDVTSTGATTILVDFDGDQSVKQTGNGVYTMAPVMTVVSVQ